MQGQGARRPLATWPVTENTVLGHMLAELAGQGFSKATVCCGHSVGYATAQPVQAKRIAVEFVPEHMPRGRGGILKDAVADGDEILVLMHANMVWLPDIGRLVAEHAAAGADLSVVKGDDADVAGLGRDGNQIFIAGRRVLDHIPEVGYCDIKEGLIPTLVRNGLNVRRIAAPQGWSTFGTWREYVQQVLRFVEMNPSSPVAQQTSCGVSDINEKSSRVNGETAAARGNGCAMTKIDQTARLCGNVWVGRGARIEENAVVIGPAVIGPGCRIGRGAVVSESILWEGSVLEEEAAATDCLVDAGAIVERGVEIVGQWCRGKIRRGTPWRESRAYLARAKKVGPSEKSIQEETVLKKAVQTAAAKLSAAAAGRVPPQAWWWIVAGALAACFLWSYWNPTIVSLWGLWMRSDEFSSGLLVPFLAVYALWVRWHRLEGVAIRPAVAWGLAAFAAAQAVRFFGLWLMYGSAENLSLVMTIWALVLLLFGWKVIWRVWPVLAFLLLMLPFPHRVQAWITVPLQRWATSSAVFGLEMLGFEVTRMGNIIELNGASVAVAEACNGLRMLTAFVVIAALVALVVERRPWEKAIVITSSVPIAFMCNTLRLVITAIAFTQLNTELWEERFHDFGGLAMMPLALGMVLGELWLLKRIVMPEEAALPVKPQIISRRVVD
ncbi:MAG TPA: exosortase [Anaerohalosphaeraceae bacterium]|nr:exosortase [Anaerohalosphaeraceae bacterium]HRT51723.1 exosortase [Anaerohalosphaeraceae bacterium]HRT88092.1 exosortase [Anaerohalosphaeraceae bacterium]